MTATPPTRAAELMDSSPSTEAPPKRLVVRRRHPVRALLVGLVVLACAGAAYGVATNQYIEWSVVGEFLFHGSILRGLLVTLEMTVVGMVLSLVFGAVLAPLRMSQSRVLSSLAKAYIFTFRGIPLILLLILVGNLGLFIKEVRIPIPFTDATLFQASMSDMMTPFIASVIGLTLAGSAYLAEIIRGGILSVGRGQHRAAMALGLSRFGTMRFIVMPQALRVIVPPMGNEFINLIKATAIVSVIGGGDLLTVAQSISGTNYRTLEMLLVAALWYFAIIAVLSVGQRYLEQRYAER
jgi:polar amino acid transport system permease protein